MNTTDHKSYNRSYITRKNIYIIAAVVISLIIAYFFYTMRVQLFEILRPILIALILSYLVNPLISNLELKKVPRNIAIFVVYIFFLCTFASVILFLIPSIISSIRELTVTVPLYLERAQILFYELTIRYRHSEIPLSIKDTIEKQLYGIQQSMVDLLQSIISGVTHSFSMIIDFILGAVISYYILKDVDKFKKAFTSFIPRKERPWMSSLIRDIDIVIAGFIRGQLLVAIILSVFTGIGLKLIGVKYALILGLIAGMADVIPYFGPVLGIVPAVIVAFIDKPMTAVWVILLYFIIQQIEGGILSPKIVGGRVGLHPAVTIVAVIVGGKLFGLVGLLFSVPVFAIIKVIVNRVIQRIV